MRSRNSATCVVAARGLFTQKPCTMAVRTWAIGALAALALAGPGVPALAGIVYNVTNDLADQNGWSLAGTITLSGTGTFSNASAITAWDVTASKNSTSNRYASTASGAGKSFSGTLGATSSVLSLDDNSHVTFWQDNTSRWVNWYNNFDAGMGPPLFNQNNAVWGNSILWDTDQFSPIVGGSWTLGTAASSAVPEIDPSGLSAVLGLIAGGLGLLERLRKCPDAATAARRVMAMAASRPRLPAACGGGSVAV